MTRTASFLGTHHRKRTSDFYPKTPPTPVSPHTPQTPPSLQKPPSASPPTPVTSDVLSVFKRAKRDNIVQSQHDLVRSAVPILRHGEKKTLEQTYLDLGQRDFGKRTICSTCGMLYVHGLNEDAQQHSRICLAYMKGIPFDMSQARVVDSNSVGSIVEVRGFGTRCCVLARHIFMLSVSSQTKRTSSLISYQIRPTDSYALRTKVKCVRDIVDRDLGFVPSDDSAPRTAYLYIVNKRVVGMATAEVIQRAFVLQNSLERSLQPQKAMIGVHQLWVHAKFRKQGVATRLVDAVRANFVFGLTVPKEMLAFSSPTEAGSRFARNYVCGNPSKGTREILVYDCC